MDLQVAAAALALLTVSQAPEGGDSLGDTYQRTRSQLSRQAGSAGGSTVLAYDRGVTELVQRYSGLWLELEAGQVRVTELRAAAAAVRAIDLADFNEQGRMNHEARLRNADSAVAMQQSKFERDCALAAAALGELRGRVAGKVDSLFAAEGACGSLASGAPPTLCARVAETRAVYEALADAVTREKTRVASVCGDRP